LASDGFDLGLRAQDPPQSFRRFDVAEPPESIDSVFADDWIAVRVVLTRHLNDEAEIGLLKHWGRYIGFSAGTPKEQGIELLAPQNPAEPLQINTLGRSGASSRQLPRRLVIVCLSVAFSAQHVFVS
jgi:hypothetical protein